MRYLALFRRTEPSWDLKKSKFKYVLRGRVGVEKKLLKNEKHPVTKEHYVETTWKWYFNGNSTPGRVFKRNGKKKHKYPSAIDLSLERNFNPFIWRTRDEANTRGKRERERRKAWAFSSSALHDFRLPEATWRAPRTMTIEGKMPVRHE